MSNIEENNLKIKSIVADILEIEEEELRFDSHFVDEHGADSLRAIEVLATVEKEFKTQIPQEELANMSNLGSVCSIVAKYAGWEA